MDPVVLTEYTRHQIGPLLDFHRQNGTELVRTAIIIMQRPYRTEMVLRMARETRNIKGILADIAFQKYPKP